MAKRYVRDNVKERLEAIIREAYKAGDTRPEVIDLYHRVKTAPWGLADGYKHKMKSLDLI